MEKRNPNLEEIDEELKDFVDSCKQSKLSDKKIGQICEQLSDGVNSYERKKRACIIGLMLCPILIIYVLTCFETTNWHVAAMGRYVLVKFLPLWNWRALGGKKCLIRLPNINEVDQFKIKFDCALCESMNQIYVEKEINDTYLKQHYIDLHKPVILLDKLQDWPIFKNPDWSSIKNKVFDRSHPCHLSTNVYNGETNVGRILKRLKEFDEFFLHFQNCEFDGMKAFRPFAPKIDCIPDDISPIQYSWLLISQNYNVTAYKSIDLTEPITVIGQVKGRTSFKLIPRENCGNVCPELNIELERGEALVATSLWDLVYKTNPEGDGNLAVVLEMR